MIMIGRSARGRRVRGVLGITLAFALLSPLANVASAQTQTRDLKPQLRLPHREVVQVPEVTAVAPKAAPKAESKPAAGGKSSLQLSSSGKVKVAQGPDDPPPATRGCSPYVYVDVVPIANGVARVDYSGVLDCNFLVRAYGQAYLIDRTPGAPTNGLAVNFGVPFSFNAGSYGRSPGAVFINGRVGLGGRQFEIGFDFVVQAVDGGIWVDCLPLQPPLSYMQPCTGTGTSTINVSVGLAPLYSGIPNLAGIVRQDPRISLIDFHVGGGVDPASTARQNIIDASEGRPARTSNFAGPCCASLEVPLDTAMLIGMLRLADAGYSYEVSALAGSRHDEDPPVSRHYLGKAVDVRSIFGSPVSPANSYWRQFKAACQSFGATEPLGPGDPGHNGHVHCGWPR
jgi:hypothetical protein